MRRWVAQYYKVPLTDPRLDEYTDELFMIEMAFLKKEQPDLFKGEVFSDPNYEEWVKNAIAEESKIIRDDKERAGKVMPGAEVQEMQVDVDVSAIDLDDTDTWEPVD